MRANDPKAEQSHGETAALRRKRLHERHHDERLQHAGSKPLHDTSEYNRRKIRTESTNHRAEGEQDEGDGKGQLHAEFLHRPGANQQACRHCGKKGGRDELDLVLPNAEGPHDIWHRDVDDTAGQDCRRERRQYRHRNQPRVSGAVTLP